MDEAGDMQDLFVDDWDGIFDDDGPVDDLSFDGFDNLEPDAPAPTAADEKTKLKRANSEPTRRRRSGREIEGGGRGLPPPSWHSEAADRPHRQAMIVEV